MTIRLDALPELAQLWDQLVAIAAGEGIGVGIEDWGGFRTVDDTAQILAFKQADYDEYAAAARAAGHEPNPITGPWDNGSSRPIAPYGQSFHNYGAARDFAIDAVPAGMSMDDAVSRVQAIGVGLGFRSGASYGDDRHLELTIPLADAAAAWAAYQGAGATSTTILLVGMAAILGVVTVLRLFQRWRPSPITAGP